MKISSGYTIPKSQALILFMHEGESAPCGLPQRKGLAQEAAALGFKGKENSAVVFNPKGGSPAKQVILSGIGSKKNLQPETLRRAAALGVKRAAAL